MILKARVERLEALWSINRRKPETRGKIIIGGALIAEAAASGPERDPQLVKAISQILDRRVLGARDRLIVRELLGRAPLAQVHDDEGDADVAGALASLGHSPHEDDMLNASAMADD